MSAGGRQGRAPDPGASDRPQETPVPSLPRPIDPARAVGAGRMDWVHAERREAAAQIARTQRVWRKASGVATGAAAIPEGGGDALRGGVRARMESRMGVRLPDVKVHTDGASADAASRLGARAFTVGSDVHFNRGEFSPGTPTGDRLLAHELTHVVQAERSGVQRKAEAGDEEGGDGVEVSSPDEPAEQEADAVAERAAGADGTDEAAPPIAAKLQGVGTKLFRAPGPNTPASQPPVEKTVRIGEGQKTLRADPDNGQVIVVGEGALQPLLTRADTTASGGAGGGPGAPQPPSPDATAALGEARGRAQEANALVPQLAAPLAPNDPGQRATRTRMDQLLGAVASAWSRFIAALGVRAPLPPSVSDPTAIPRASNVPVGNPLDGPGPGHGVLSRLSVGDREALAPVGVGPLPPNFRPNSCEWGLGQLPSRQCIVIKGNVDAVNWGPLQGVVALAHSHPMLEDGSNRMQPASGGGMRFQELIQNEDNLTHLFPSAADFRFCFDRGIRGHKVHTPFMIDAHDQVSNPATGGNAPTQQGTPIMFDIGEVRRYKPAREGVFLQSQVTASGGGRQIWQGTVYSIGGLIISLRQI
jgi:hypothetical protein